jgi:hypothetical protein
MRPAEKPVSDVPKSLRQLDRVIMGHNQFIGVSYLSWEEGRRKAEMFKDVNKICELLDISLDHGISSFMFSNNQLAYPLMAKVGVMSKKRDREISVYPVVPFFQKYVRDLATKSMARMAYDLVAEGSASDKAKLLAKGTQFLLGKDPYKLIESVIDIELLPFKNNPMPVVFLHNEVTNLMLALDARELTEFIVKYVHDKYKTVAGFGTDNFVAATEKFNAWGIKQPVIMTAFNKLGFLMNPSRDACEKALQSFDGQLVAMSTLAGGRLVPAQAYEYLLRFSNVHSIIVGYSSKVHALETIAAIRQASENNGRDWLR